MRWAGHVARMGEGRGVYRVLVGKPEGKRPMGRPRRRWEDNIKMDLQEVGGGCGDWMELAQDRERWRALVNTVRNLRVPKMRGISWLAAEPVSFSRRTLLHGVSDNNATLAPELLCHADVSSLVTSVLCPRTVGSMAYTGNGSNRTNYMRLSSGNWKKILNSLLQ